MAIQLAGVQLGILTGGPSSLTLEDLADVSVTSPQTGQYLRYNAGISEWQNEYINSDVYAFLTGTALGLSGTGLTSSNGITLTALSGPETIDIGLSLSVTGDATGTVTSGTLDLTLETVNSDVGTYGSAFEVPIITVDGKGLITSITTVAVSSSSANITGGSAGEIPWQSAPNTTLFTAAGTSNQLLQSNGTSSPTWTSAPTITGTNISGTATSLNIGGNAATVTTNANLTGDVTSVGNATTVVSVGGNDITLAGAFTTSGAYALTLTTGGTTNVTLPTSGTLATTTNINTALPSATTSQLYGGSGVDGIADIVTVGSGLSLSGGTLTSTGSGGTVTSVSVASANGFAGTVATATTTPAITLSTSVTGILKGTGTAISTATAGTDYSVGTSALGTGILKSTTGTGALTIAVAADFPTLNQDTTGNAATATTSTNIAIASTSTNAPFYITLVDSASGYQPLDVDTGFSLNPSTGAMTVPGTITVTSGTITNLNSPLASSDAATKAYVDAATAGLNVHGAVQTTDTGTEITGAAGITYTAGVAGGSPDTGAGVGAILSGTGTIPVIGGYTLTAAGQRVLIKQFTGGLNVRNGIYVVTTLTGGWVLTRASDFNNSTYGQVEAGDLAFVANGTDAGTSWVQTSVGSQSPGGVTKIGTDAIVFTQFSGAGTYIAGTGLSLTGNTFANTGVLSVTTNTGLSTNTSATGNVTITNTGVTSLVAGTNISVSSATGAVTVNVTGTVASATTATTATNLSGTTRYSVPYQTGSATTGYLSPGTAGSVLITNSTGSAPSWSTTPTIAGTNFSSIPNNALTNSSVTIGSTSVALGATAATISGLTLVAPTLGTPTSIVLTNASGTAISLTAGSANTAYAQVVSNNATYPIILGSQTTTGYQSQQIVTGFTFNPSTGTLALPSGGSVAATTFTGALSGNATTATTATTATNIAAGTANQIPYQTGAGATLFFSAANYGVQIYGSTGVPTSLAGAAGVLQGSASANPAFTTTPTLTGTNFTGIPNSALTNSTTTLGASVLTLGSTTNTLNYAATVTLASAATINIGAANSNAIIISGTTTITAFDTIAAGAVRMVEFSGILTLTYNSTSLILPGSANITTAAGDTAEFISLGSGNWRCNYYTKANGTAIVASNGSPYSTTQVFNGSSSVTAMKVTNVTELVDVVAAAPSSTQTFYVASGAVQLYTTNAANNWIINFGWSSGTTMNTEMSIGDSVTVCMLITQGATPYYVTAVQIDGIAQTVHWQGGSAPTAGYASGIDAYNFAIIKTASATYTVLGSLTQF